MQILVGSTAPVVGVIARDQLGASVIQLGVLATAPVAGNILSGLWAMMMEGRRKMPFVVFGWACAALFLSCMFYAHTSWAFIGVVAGMYFCHTISATANSAILKEIYPDHSRASIMGYIRVFSSSAFMLSSAVAGAVLTAVSYRYYFPLISVIGILGAVVYSRIPTSSRPKSTGLAPRKFFSSYMRLLVEDKAYMKLCAGVFVFGFANFIAVPVYTLYQVDVLGVDTAWAGAYGTIASAMSLLSMFFWGKYIDRVSAARSLVTISMLWIALPLIYIAANSPWMLVPAFILIGSVGAGVDLTYINTVLQFAPEDRITHYQSIFSVLMGVRGIIAPMTGSLLVESGVVSHHGIFVLSAVLILVGHVLIRLAAAQVKSN